MLKFKLECKISDFFYTQTLSLFVHRFQINVYKDKISMHYAIIYLQIYLKDRQKHYTFLSQMV